VSLEAENMIEVPENGHEGGQAQGLAKAVLSLFRSSFLNGGLYEFEQAWIKLCSFRYLGDSSRFSLGSLKAENMIKVPENG